MTTTEDLARLTALAEAAIAEDETAEQTSILVFATSSASRALREALDPQTVLALIESAQLGVALQQQHHDDAHQICSALRALAAKLAAREP